LIAIS